MKTANDVLIGIATYNEIDNLPRLVDELSRNYPDADILVVDDNSPDGTGQWCDDRGRSYPALRCLHREAKQGVGTAVRVAMQEAIAGDYRLFVNLDADHSHDPQYIGSLIEQLDQPGQAPADVVIASRYVRGGGIEGWPIHRRWMSWGVNQLSRSALGLTPRDCSGSFRCYRTSTLRQLDFHAIRSSGYSFFEEVLFRLQCRGAIIREIPFVFRERKTGRTKISTREALKSLSTISILGIQRMCRG